METINEVVDMAKKDRKGFLIVKGWDSYNKWINESELPKYKEYIRKNTGLKRIHTTLTFLKDD